MASRKKVTEPQVKKSDVSVPAPGVATRFALLGNRTDTTLVTNARRGLLDIYYRMYSTHPVVRAATEKIAKVATANGFLFKSLDPENPTSPDKIKELQRLFRESDGLQLLRLTYKDLVIYGQAFWLVRKTKSGKPIESLRLNPKYIEKVVKDGVLVSYKYGANGEPGTITYAIEDICDFKLDDPESDIYGLSLLHSLQTTVASDLYAQAYNGSFFENSAQTGIIFNMKNASVDEIFRNREWLEANYVGSANAHRPLLLEGDITVSKAVSTPQEMQFVEGRKFNRDEILSVLDIPPDKVGFLENSNRSTSKESDNSFRQETILPLQSIVEEEINNKLILRMLGWDDVVFAHREISRRDQMENTKFLTELQKMGVLNADDIRSDLGLGHVEGGDIHFVQTAAGMIPLKLIEALGQKIVDGNASASSLITGLGTKQNG
jgi:HK97 family phage portal protein